MSMPQPVSLTLDTDPKTALSVSFLQGSQSAPLIIFLNGLIKPASAFEDCVSQFLNLVENKEPKPSILLWDRYGQGLSGKQQHDHVATDVVKTLHEILTKITPEKVDKQDLILVANSIGVPLARLYAAQYPIGIKGFLFLDSMIAHSDFISIFEPLPDADEEEVKQLASARAITSKFFNPSNRNPEGFNRLHLKNDVPYSDQPALPGQPFVTVVGHDPDIMAQENEQKMGISARLTNKYLNAEWHKYNEGLIKLTIPSRSRGPIIAQKANHFIQSSRPDLVAEELQLLWEKVLQGV